MARAGIRLGLVLAAGLAIWLIPAEGGTAGADLIFTNATVRTVDSSNPSAEAVAVEAGEITVVGTNQEAMAQRGAETTVVDLSGKTLIPGFHDVHLHAVEAGRTANGCYLPSRLSARQYIRRLRGCARRQRGEVWVRAAGPFVQDLLALAIEPRDLIDRAIPNRPVVILDALGHAAFVNSEGLRRSGLDTSDRDPAGGAILRDSGGRPNGVVLENAQNVVLDAVERPSRQNRQANYASLHDAIGKLSANGITSVSDAGGYWPRQHHLAWLQLSREGKLDVRASNALWVYPNRSLQSQLHRISAIRDAASGPHLAFDQVKLYVDGIVDYGTAALTKPYLHRPNWAPGGKRGFTYLSRARLNRTVAAFDRRGFQIHLHVWGDRAAKMALDAIERARRLNGPPNRPHRLTHLYLIDRPDLPRFADLGAVADFQLGEEAISPGYERFLRGWIGRRAAAHLLPIATVLRAGALTTLSSDWDADALSPLKSIERGLTRRGSPERIPDPATGLQMVTLNSARLLGQADETGSIEVGKRADLVVLNGDPIAVPAARIGEIRVLQTLLDGRTVYRRP